MSEILPREERDILITLVADVKHLSENQTNFHDEIKSQISEIKDGFAQRLNTAESKIESLGKEIANVRNKLFYYTGGIAVVIVIAEALFQYFISKK